MAAPYLDVSTKRYIEEKASIVLYMGKFNITPRTREAMNEKVTTAYIELKKLHDEIIAEMLTRCRDITGYKAPKAKIHLGKMWSKLSRQFWGLPGETTITKVGEDGPPK